MIDPILSLAFGMHSKKGAYALLLGSGVSRAAGIPTGWEVVLDLIRKLAAMNGESCEPEPASWYQKTFRGEPNYDELINNIAKSSSERNQLLRAYFEPTETEREQGLKIPTQAHKAIARLVSTGHIRAIITTNFDRLIENAIESLGIIPTVLSTPDSQEGALPLIHTNCTILKLHGDYLDVRIKNTPGELAKYDRRTNRLLDRLLDEFGLIVCGWSADWDVALRTAIERCKTQRFGTYWTVHGVLSDAAQRLIAHRRAEIVPIKNANTFFNELDEKLSALSEMSRPHPLSVKAAILSLKRYIVDDHYKIALHDLVMNEIERVYSEILGPNFSAVNKPINTKTVSTEIKKYDALIEILLGLFSTGCYWGDDRHQQLWVKSLERLVNLPPGVNISMVWAQMRLYPSLAALYAGGIAALAAGNYRSFYALLTKVEFRTIAEKKPLVLILYPQGVIEDGVAHLVPDLVRHYTPLNDHLFLSLRNPLREFLPNDDEYNKTFDRFEYFRALVHGDLLQKSGKRIWGAPGRFVWKHRNGESMLSELEAELNAEGGNWAPLKAGLFDGSKGRVREIKEGIDKMVSEIPWD